MHSPAAAAGATQPGGDTDPTPGGCLVVAYVHDGSGHYSLLMNGTYLMGSTVTVVSDCPIPLAVRVDDAHTVVGVSGLESPLPAGYPRTVQVWANGTLVASWSNLSVYPGLSFTGTMLDQGQGDAWMIGGLTMTAEDLAWRQVLVTIGAGLITFALVTQVLHRIVRSWTERRFIQEVVP
jgi:hypothetical protein